MALSEHARTLLIVGRRQIDEPSKLCKGQVAVDVNGNSASSWNGVAFCSYGALLRAHHMLGLQEFQAAFAEAHKALNEKFTELHGTLPGIFGYIDFNDADWVTHDDVMRLWDATIAS